MEGRELPFGGRFLLVLLSPREDILLVAVRTSHPLAYLRRRGISLHPGALEVILLVDHLVVRVQEDVVCHKEVERGPIDLELIGTVDLRTEGKVRAVGKGW